MFVRPPEVRKGIIVIIVIIRI
jgi:hypothetical protein